MTKPTDTPEPKGRPDWDHGRRQRRVAAEYGLADPVPSKPRKRRTDNLRGALEALHEAGAGSTVFLRDSWSSGAGSGRAIDGMLQRLGLRMDVHAELDESCQLALTWCIDAPQFRSRFNVGAIESGMVAAVADDALPPLPLLKDGTQNRLRGWRWLVTDCELWRRAKWQARKYARFVVRDHGDHFTVERLRA